MPSSGAPTALLDRLASLAAARGGILARRDLESCGFSANEIRGLVHSGALDHLHRDAYRVPAPDDGPWSRYPAAVRAATRSDPARLLTGPAALTIHGLPTFGPQMAIHGGLDDRGGSSRRSLISTVAMPPSEQRAVIEGVRVASPARAVLDTARLTTVVAGVMAADAALRRGLTTPEELGAVLATMRGLAASPGHVCAASSPTPGPRVRASPGAPSSCTSTASRTRSGSTTSTTSGASSGAGTSGGPKRASSGSSMGA